MKKLLNLQKKVILIGIVMVQLVPLSSHLQSDLIITLKTSEEIINTSNILERDTQSLSNDEKLNGIRKMMKNQG